MEEIFFDTLQHLPDVCLVDRAVAPRESPEDNTIVPPDCSSRRRGNGLQVLLQEFGGPIQGNVEHNGGNELVGDLVVDGPADRKDETTGKGIDVRAVPHHLVGVQCLFTAPRPLQGVVVSQLDSSTLGVATGNLLFCPNGFGGIQWIRLTHPITANAGVGASVVKVKAGKVDGRAVSIVSKVDACELDVGMILVDALEERSSKSRRATADQIKLVRDGRTLGEIGTCCTRGDEKGSHFRGEFHVGKAGVCCDTSPQVKMCVLHCNVCFGQLPVHGYKGFAEWVGPEARVVVVLEGCEGVLEESRGIGISTEPVQRHLAHQFGGTLGGHEFGGSSIRQILGGRNDETVVNGFVECLCCG